MLEKLKSRKFLFGAALFLVLILNKLVGEPLDAETQEKLLQVALIYIGGEALVDFGRGFRKG